MLIQLVFYGTLRSHQCASHQTYWIWQNSVEPKKKNKIVIKDDDVDLLVWPHLEIKCGRPPHSVKDFPWPQWQVH